MPSWKTALSKKKKTQKTKLALIVLGIVLAILALAQLVKFSQMLFSPWRIKIGSQQTFSWDSKSNINFLVKSASIALVSFNPTEEQITLVNIPDETLVETSHGFGTWQLRAVYDFGQLQKDIGGYKLLKDSLSYFFGLPIEGIVEGDLANMIKNKKVSFFSFSNLKSDLSLIDLIKLEMKISKVRFDKIKQIDLRDSVALDRQKLADGSDVLGADYVRLDQLISELSDPTIVSEHKTIAVFNSTNYPGLAQTAARLISNIGGDVIIVTNSKNKYQKTQIAGEKSKTLTRLKQIFETSDTIEPGDEDLDSSRAQINLFLGEDYFNKL